MILTITTGHYLEYGTRETWAILDDVVLGFGMFAFASVMALFAAWVINR